MKSIKITSIFLCLAVILLAIFVGGKTINSKIEETIKSNYQSEIDALKDKLNKQSELLNSIINLNNENDETDDVIQNNNNNTNDTSSNIGSSSNTTNKNEDTIVEFEYIKENGGITITKYIGSKTTVQIPNKMENLPVLKIGENAFAETKVKSVTLPSSCTEIDWFAFYGCYALNTVYISNNVSMIGYGAFESCSKSLVIYCEKGSYAQKFAQSFGISYSYFN